MTQKDIMIILLERRNSLDEIKTLTGFDKNNMYYAHSQYKKACQRIEELKELKAKGV